MAIKTFVSGEILTASDTNTYLNNAGWVYITSVDFGGNTAVNLDGCFTATYDTYEIIVSNFRGASAGYLYVQTRASGVTDTTANYSYAENLGGISANQTEWRVAYSYSTTTRGNGRFTVFSPFDSGAQTAINSFSGARNAAANYLQLTTTGQKQSATSDTGFRFTHSGGAVAMNGLITVLGQRKA